MWISKLYGVRELGRLGSKVLIVVASNKSPRKSYVSSQLATGKCGNDL